MQKRRLLTTAMFCLGFSAGSAQGAELRGSVALSGATVKPPARYVVRGQTLTSRSTSASGMVAIAVEHVGEELPLQIPDTPFVMAQENTSFVPNLLVVPVGARVTFPNYDAFFHNVFSYSPPRSFDLGRYPKGETRTVRFEEAGLVRIFCEIHSSMYATILVANTEHYQIVSTSDGFVFPDLEKGRYRVLAVDASGRKAKAEVELKSDETLALPLTLE